MKTGLKTAAALTPWEGVHRRYEEQPDGVRVPTEGEVAWILREEG